MSKPDDHDEPFLVRWSRRKRDAQAEPSPPVGGDADALSRDVPDEVRTGAKPDKAAEEPELDLSKLPKVEELTAQSDISVFLDKRVPQLLRNAALSRMWSLDPTIRDFIEVAEYQWNWNIPGDTPFYEEIITAPAELGQAIARAGADAGRQLVSEAPTSPTGSLGDDAASVIRLKDETPREGVESGDAAVQDNQCCPLDTAAPDSSAIPGEIGDERARQGLGVAVQHGRRRHGGALPG